MYFSAITPELLQLDPLHTIHFDRANEIECITITGCCEQWQWSSPYNLSVQMNAFKQKFLVSVYICAAYRRSLGARIR